MKEHPPTLKSIAERVGMTANTVSLALRDSPRVADETRARIQSIASEMGYVQNAIAGSLRSGRSNTLAVIMGDIANPLFAAKIKAFERAFREKGYQLMIFNSDEDPDLELEAVRTAIGRKVDGVVLCPTVEPDRALALLRQHHVPCVLNGRLNAPGHQDAVVWDDRYGGYLAASHLLQCGCRRIAWLGVTQRISSARDRKLGYLAALEEAGCTADPTLILEVSPTGGDVSEMLSPLISQELDGICAFSDLIAWEAACFLEERGLRIPADIQLTGFDAAASHLRLPYRLTSVSADLDREAAEVARIMTMRMQNRESPAAIVRIATTLVTGSSTQKRSRKIS